MMSDFLSYVKYLRMLGIDVDLADTEAKIT